MIVTCHVTRQISKDAVKKLHLTTRRWQTRHFASNATTERFDFNPISQCSVLEWAATSENHSVASECLDVPSALPEPMSSSSEISNWDDYWRYRRWTFPTALKNSTEREHGQALSSHVMSAPMTMYSKIDELLESCIVASTKTSKKLEDRTMTVKWCCIGARSEASLPIQYWQEFVDIVHARRKLLRQIHPKKDTPKVLRISIDFIGPEMNLQEPITLQPTKPLEQEHEEYDFVNGSNNATTSDDNEYSDVATYCTIHWRYKGLFHTYYNDITTNPTVGWNDKRYDAFILFNPGVGHAHLQTMWQPTLQLIFEQYYRIRNTYESCTIVLTAHSATDAIRDSQLLQHYRLFADSTNITTIQGNTTDNNIINNNESEKIVESSNIPIINYYEENPFSSRIYYLDPIVPKAQESDTQQQQEENHIIRPNHYIAVFRRR